MKAIRIKLEHCQYGVADYTNPDDNFNSDCGEPAVAHWSWPEDPGGIFVCEKHDRQLQEKEEYE